MLNKRILTILLITTVVIVGISNNKAISKEAITIEHFRKVEPVTDIVYIEGKVKNNTKKLCTHLKIEAVWYSGDNKLIAKSSTKISNLKAGETRFFKTNFTSLPFNKKPIITDVKIKEVKFR